MKHFIKQQGDPANTPAQTATKLDGQARPQPPLTWRSAIQVWKPALAAESPEPLRNLRRRSWIFGSHSAFVMAVVIGLFAGQTFAAPEEKGRTPTLDSQGRFWIYRNGTNQPVMPFAPYGWMSDVTNLTQLIQVDVECRERPNTISKSTWPTEKESCIRLKVKWDDTATWASVAFISGPDKPAWWGENNKGRHFNLSGLAKKKLVFFARGERGGEIIKAQIGVLAKKPFGDSLSEPFVSKELKLTPDWARCEVDLKDIPVAELARVCNGFGIIAERSTQPEGATETQFYIDDVYLE